MLINIIKTLEVTVNLVMVNIQSKSDSVIVYCGALFTLNSSLKVKNKCSTNKHVYNNLLLATQYKNM